MQPPYRTYMITIHLDERDPALLTVSFPHDPIGNDRFGL
ncbi:hypothetical protein BN8_03610 [Fibrisoma limi BUZ 3]|uniref:Uncharacterized protein n=1 Tax=Fibrisoma limi BUZ 3 TaxID=1185876 RepID=I2GKL5_9BACT|nr:hypothetical protein BN8_03610 [Fibrisoma limi BUZ 3]